MGELSDTLDEFQEISKKYYDTIMEILEDKYCWKCPMRTNSKETLCREVEAWIRLGEAVESGVKKELELNDYSWELIEVITAKFLEKKTRTRDKQDKSFIYKLEYDAAPHANSDDFIYVITHPVRVKKNDLVLMPQACPLAMAWYQLISKNPHIPFKIYKVSHIFQKKGCRYIKTQEGIEIPVEYLIGVVQNIIRPQDLEIKE